MLRPMHVPALFAALLANACLCAATAIGFDGVQKPLSGIPAIERLDAVVYGSGSPAALTSGMGVALADGSWLPATAITGATGADRLLVRGPLGTCELPLELVAGWGNPAPPATVEGDAVLVESGLLGGRLLGLREGKLRFQSTLDPEPLAIAIEEIRGARLAVPRKRIDVPRLRARLAPGRPGLDLLPVADGLVLAVAPTIRIDPTGLGGLALRVEGGRRTYLSDLNPATVREEGMFGVVWPFARDQAISGGLLRVAGISYAKGISVHSAATLTWNLDAAYVRLRTQIGICDSVAPEGDCVGILAGDGRELWRARVRGGDPVRALDLDLSGVKVLTLTVETGEHLDIGDHLVLADAQLVRK